MKILESDLIEGLISASVSVARCGLVVVQVDGVDATDISSAAVYDQNGVCMTAEKFSGATVAIDLSGRKGMIIIHVSTHQGRTALKVML